MESNIKYSIIVPVFNNEEYICDCLESIERAALDIEKEIIFIDDGSTDKSGSICDQFATKWQYVKVIHTKNKGVSAARNLGIDKACGDVVFFVDSDDMVERDYFKELTFVGDEDFVYSGFKTFNSLGEIDTIRYTPEEEYVDILRKNLSKKWLKTPIIFCHNACYRKSILDKYHIRFDESIHFGEDTKFNLSYLKSIEKYRISDKAGYLYRVNRKSAVHQFHENRLEKEECELRMLDNFQENDPDFGRMKWYYWHIVLQHYYHHLSISDNNQKKKIRQLIKSTFSNSYFKSSISYIRKKGSLDEKIESWIMSFYRYKLYNPMISILRFADLVKKAIGLILC